MGGGLTFTVGNNAMLKFIFYFFPCFCKVIPGALTNKKTCQNQTNGLTNCIPCYYDFGVTLSSKVISDLFQTLPPDLPRILWVCSAMHFDSWCSSRLIDVPVNTITRCRPLNYISFHISKCTKYLELVFSTLLIQQFYPIYIQSSTTGPTNDERPVPYFWRWVPASSCSNWALGSSMTGLGGRCLGSVNPEVDPVSCIGELMISSRDGMGRLFKDDP